MKVNDKEFVCEWHSDAASMVVAVEPNECKVIFCRRCKCRTWHAPIDMIENSPLEMMESDDD